MALRFQYVPELVSHFQEIRNIIKPEFPDIASQIIGGQVICLIQVHHGNELSVDQEARKLFDQELSQSFVFVASQNVKVGLMQDRGLEGFTILVYKVQVETCFFVTAAEINSL